jgi:hypothetical protein
METIRFDTMVRKRGIIRTPALENYVNQNVEVTIVVKEKSSISTVKSNISDFFDKWTGFFKIIDTDDIKYNYLMEKHK